MARLSENQLASVIRIGQLSQECLSETDFADIMTQEMLRTFDSRSAVFLEFEQVGEASVLGESMSFGLDDVHSERYSNHYHTLDPCYREFERLRQHQSLPSVATSQVIENQHEYINSEYYEDFLRPTNVHESLIFGLGDHNQLNGLVGLHRHAGEAAYSETEQTMVQLVTPYLSTAILFRQREREIQRQSVLREMVLRSANVQGYLVLNEGLVCLDAGGSLRALGMLSDYSETELVGVSLRRALPEKLLTCIDQALAGQGASEPNSDIFDNLVAIDHVRITLVQDSIGRRNVLLTVLDPEIQLSDYGRMQFFALTKRQRDVVHFVQMGLTNSQIAASLNISQKTVVNHLTQIYEKTQTHNRVSLIRQLYV
ncbi:MAG: LuxR C-terminal-related transcriptional regulator [Pseudomonadota bacterium]